MVTSLVAGLRMPACRAGEVYGRHITLCMENDIHALVGLPSAEELVKHLQRHKRKPVVRGDYTVRDRVRERVGTFSNPRIEKGRVTVDICLFDSDLLIHRGLVIEPLMNANYPSPCSVSRDLEVIIGIYPQ